MSSQRAKLKDKIVPDISAITSVQQAFDLDKNFNKHLEWALSVPHDQALLAEAEKLSPLFNALAEYAETGMAALSKSQQLQKNRESLKQDQAAEIDFTKVKIDAADIKASYIKIARVNKSLILCDMPITDVGMLENQATQSVTDWRLCEKDSTTFFPQQRDIRSYRGWGFMQLYRPESKTRISMPVLGLTDAYPLDQVLADNRSVINRMQTIGRISNHDWLHHITMYNVNHLIARTEDAGEFFSDVERMKKNIPFVYTDGSGLYEAFCVKTHTALLQMDSAKPLWEKLRHEVGALTEDIYKMFETTNKVNADKLEHYKAINYLAIATARILRRAEPIDGTMTQDFLNAVVGMSTKGSAVARKARNKVWNCRPFFSQDPVKKAKAKLKNQYIKSGLYDEIYQDNEFSTKNPELAARLAVACKKYAGDITPC